MTERAGQDSLGVSGKYLSGEVVGTRKKKKDKKIYIYCSTCDIQE